MSSHALDVGTKVALIVGSIAIVISSTVDVYSRLRTPAPAVSNPPRTTLATIRPGTKAPVISGIDYFRADRTMVLFLSTTCTFCQQSAPFYRELSAKLADKNGRKRVGVFPQPADEVTQYKQREKLDFEVIPDTPLNSAGVSGTPTMLLVSRQGAVIQAWVGAPRQHKEAITRALASN